MGVHAGASRDSRLSTHLHEPPPNLQRHDASRSSHTRAHRSSPRFASVQTRSFLPRSSRALASPRARLVGVLLVVQTNRTRPNSTQLDRRTASTRRDRSRRAARRRASDRSTPLSTLDARFPSTPRVGVSRVETHRASSIMHPRARARLDRSRSRSMRVDRWKSIAIDESRSMEVDDRRRVG